MNEPYRVNDSYATTILHEQILNCDNLEDFSREILDSLQSQRVLWQKKITTIIEENGYNVSAFAALCGVSRMAVKKWCDGALPQSRDAFIRIGFAAHYDLEEMNLFLKRFGRFPALYPKSLEDSVYIFVLHSETIPHTYAMCEKILNQVHILMNEEAGAALELGLTEEESFDAENTVSILSELLSVETEQELLQFARKNSKAYKSAYEKFYEYIKGFIEENSKDAVTGESYSLHAFANLQGWSSSLRKCVSAIYKGNYFPLRRKVIALGLFLNMDLDQINTSLRLANMEELYAKNPLESAIIYALEDARLNDMIFCDGSVELVEYVCKVLRELKIPEAEEFVLGLYV